MNDAEFIAAQMLGSSRKASTDRERLADVAHRKRCASHKGRNHWRNWERRMMAAEKKRLALAKLEAKKPALERYRDAVRDYWAGRRAALPALPALPL